MESSQSYANPGPPRYPCSVCFKNVTRQGTRYLCARCSHLVHSRCSGLRTLQIIVEPMAGSVPHVGHHHSHLPHRLARPHVHHVRQDVQHTSVERQRHRQQTDETKHFHRGAERKSGQHPELHSSTTGSTPRPRRRLTVFIHNSVSFTRNPLSTTSKNDPHLEELTISIAMHNTGLLITNVYIPPGQLLQWVLFITTKPHAEEILPRLTRRTLDQLRTIKSHFLKSYLHKVDAKIHPSPL